MEKVKLIPQLRPTPEQRDWLDKQKKKTGNTEAAIIRTLINEAMKKDGHN